MNIELNQEELNILIDSLLEQKDNKLYNLFHDEVIDDIYLDYLKDTLNSIYALKNKLIIYSKEYKEEN